MCTYYAYYAYNIISEREKMKIIMNNKDIM